MTFEQLRVLNAIVTEGTFHAAAEKLHKSQPALSAMLKKLEEGVGFQLLSREAYRPTLTAAGKVFYREASKVQLQMHELGTLARSLANKQEAEIILAITATCRLQPVLAMMGAVTTRFPDTHIRLSTEAMGGPLEKLMKEEADIIIASMDGIPMEEVVALPYCTVNIIPVAHPDFEPARNKSIHCPIELQSYAQIVVADSSSGSFQQSRDLLPGGLRWTVSDFASKKEIIMAKMGWGGLPEHLIADELRAGELVQLNIVSYPIRHTQLFQIRRRDREVGVVAGSLWAALSQQKSGESINPL